MDPRSDPSLSARAPYPCRLCALGHRIQFRLVYVALYPPGAGLLRPPQASSHPPQPADISRRHVTMPVHLTSRSLLLILHDAITMGYFNPYICERMGLFAPEARGKHVQRLFQSAMIPGTFSLLLPEPSLPVLLVRLLISNLPPAYNHYIKPLGGVRPALVPLVGQVAVGIILPLLATRWLVKYSIPGRGKAKKEAEMGPEEAAADASASDGASRSAPSAPEYASQVCRRATSSVKARHLVLDSVSSCSAAGPRHATVLSLSSRR